MKIIPVVAIFANQPEIIGEVRIDTDGNITGVVKKGHGFLDVLLDSKRPYSLIVKNETVKEKDNGIH